MIYSPDGLVFKDLFVACCWRRTLCFRNWHAKRYSFWLINFLLRRLRASLSLTAEYTMCDWKVFSTVDRIFVWADYVPTCSSPFAGATVHLFLILNLFTLYYPGGTVAYKLRRPYPLPYLFSSIPCIWIPCYHPHQINSPSLCNTFSISKSLQCMFSYFTGPMTSCASTWSSWRFLFGTGRHHRQMHGRPAACRYIRDNATLGTYKLARIYMDKDTSTNLSR